MDHSNQTGSVLRELIPAVFTHLRGMWRFRWTAMIVTWFICILGWAWVYSLPNVYEASARVYVDTDNILEPLLRGIAVSNDVMNEVNVVAREMISRPNIAEVARATDLDLGADTPQEFENLLTSLQKRINVSGGRDRIFSISFNHPNRQKAVTVVQSLVDTFVEKSLGADRTDSQQAQTFLQQQIEEYESRLTAAEDKLARFKRDNVELMPNQSGDYFARLQSAESDLQVVRSKLSVAGERKRELERQIEGEEPVFGIMPSPTDSAGSQGSGFAASKIRQLEAELEVLRLQYTDKHPRIGQINETIAALKEQLAENSAQSTPSGNMSSLNPLDLNPVYQNMRIQLSNIEVDIASLRAEESQRSDEVSSFRRLVDTIPQVEAELNRLNRDYGIVKAKYEQLVQQLETASIGDQVSKSIDDVQFRIIDPPFSDAKPAGPKRALFITVVLIFAIGGGLVLSFLLNQLNPVFIGKRSVTEVTGLPVLASVSLIQTRSQVVAIRLKNLLLAGGTVALVIAYALVTTFANHGSQIFRAVLIG